MAYHTENTKQICMATGHCPCPTSGVLNMNRQASQVIMVWPKTLLHGIVEGGRHRGRPHKSWEDNIKK